MSLKEKSYLFIGWQNIFQKSLSDIIHTDLMDLDTKTWSI